MTKNKLTVWKTYTARAKLKEIYVYSRRKWGKGQAKKYLAMLDKTIESVAAGKTSTKKRPEFSTRFSYCTAKRHYIFFEFQENKLVVATIFHTAMHVKERMRGEMPTIKREIDKIT